MSKVYDVRQMIYLLEEWLDMEKELDDMSECWNDPDADPCEQACSDPGLQFMKGEEMDEKWDEVKEQWDKICK